VRNISHSKGKITEILSQICARLHVKKFLLLLIVMNIEFSQHISEKSWLSNFMKIRPAGAEFFYSKRQTDAQTDRQADRETNVYDVCNIRFSRFWECVSKRECEYQNQDIERKSFSRKSNLVVVSTTETTLIGNISVVVRSGRGSNFVA